jgi:lipopolysaccharide/colanic/teichoic acid biosynthesis glycosyltransferase
MIHSQSTFTQRLKEERNRSDRNGRPFSFLLLKVHNIPSRRRAFAVQTLDSFSKTIRMSDCLGWLSEYQLGLILPDTDEKGALVVHERLNRYLTGLKKCDLNRIASDNGAILVMEYPKSLEETVLADILEDSKNTTDESFQCSTPRNGDHCTYQSGFFDCTGLSHNPNTRNLASQFDLIARRIFDLVAAAVGLIVLGPLMLGIAVLIKLTSPGPVLFRQKRVGKNGKPFTFLKFRTMYHNCDQTIHRDYVTRLIHSCAEKHDCNGSSYYKLTHDPRITSLGRLLRTTSLDELPQLINVIKGDMSLVGPRPPIDYEVENYRHWQLRRILEAKPGITGLWQVDGRSITTFADQVRLDLRYAERQSFWLNLWIIFKTFKAVFSMRGAC